MASAIVSLSLIHGIQNAHAWKKKTRWTPIAHERGVNTYLSVTSPALICFYAWKQEFICFNSCKSKKVDVRLQIKKVLKKTVDLPFSFQL